MTIKNDTTWEVTKEVGDWGEKEIKEFLLKNNILGRSLDVRFDKFNNSTIYQTLKEWDISFIKWTDDSFSRITVEVKTDKYPKNTGNINIEKNCIDGTKADIFIHFMPLLDKDNVFVIKSDKLREILKRDFYGAVVYQGNRSNREPSGNLGYCLYREKFIPVFLEAGGRMFSHNAIIPSHLNLKKFQ